MIFVRFNDPERSMYYIDPKTERVVQGYNSRSRGNRWLYHGLHSMDFPWLYKSRPSWDILLLSLLAGGTALCFTSLLLSWTLLHRKAVSIFGAAKSGRYARKFESAAGRLSWETVKAALLNAPPQSLTPVHRQIA